MRRKLGAEHSGPGPSLTTAALAAALHQAEAWNAIQLDINKSGTRLDRDFFYLTATSAA